MKNCENGMPVFPYGENISLKISSENKKDLEKTSKSLYKMVAGQGIGP